MHLPRTTIVTRTTLAVLLMLALPTIADARNRHHRQTPQQQQTETAATTTTGQSRHHVESEHARAASQEVDKILDGKMKSICRGC